MKFKHDLFSPDSHASGKYSINMETSDNIVDTPVLELGMTGSIGERYLGSVVDPNRINIFFIALGILFLIIIGRAIQVELVNGYAYNKLAEKNRIRVEAAPAPRGIIFDRNGLPIVRNLSKFGLYLNTTELSTNEVKRDQLFAKLADILKTTPTAIVEIIMTSQNNKRAIINENVGREAVLELNILASTEPAVIIEPVMRREYLVAPLSLAHVIGYEGRINEAELESFKSERYESGDLIGKIGIEKYYEAMLRGQDGVKQFEVDAAGKNKRLISEEASRPGKNLTISIDLELQKIVEQNLTTQLRLIGQNRGSAIVMKPKTGEILALVSWPAFDANKFALGISSNDYKKLESDPAKPLFPRAIAGNLPPGSTFKLMIAAAGMEEGIINEKTSITSNGGLQYGKWFYPDWKPGGHGITNLAKAIAESVNTYFYILGGGYAGKQGLGPELIAKYARVFEFGSKTGLDLPGEAAGFVPDPDWKQRVRNEPWYIGDSYYFAIGQGDTLVTPIQIARMTAVFANGGKLITPNLFKQNNIDDGQKIISDRTLNAVRAGMRLAVTGGSARSLQSLPVTSAAKTGTAQWRVGRATHAWFTSFAPYEDPEISVTVMIEEGGEGSATAAPVAKKIYEWYFARKTSIKN